MHSDTAKAEEWSRRLERLEAWEGTVKSFCRYEGVTIAMVYYWRRKLGNAFSGRSSRRDAASETRSFEAVEVVGAEPVVEVCFPHGACLRIRNGEVDVVRAVVAELILGDEPC